MRVPSRWGASALWFGPMLTGVTLLVVGGVVASDAQSEMLGVVLLVLGFIEFCAAVVLAWVWLLRGAKALTKATAAYAEGDLTTAEERCQSALRTVFRADFRTKGLHTLGLCAEAKGDFATAADLFGRALPAIPMAAAPVRKRRTRVLIRAHRGLCLLALGRRDEAGKDLDEASSEFAKGDQKGLLDALTDDASWGLGAISVNSVLMGVEGGRDPRVPLTLAWALLLVARGSPREAIDLLNRERPTLTGALSPREQALGSRIESTAHASLGEGPHRAAGTPDTPGADDSWAAAIVTGALRT